MRHTRLPLILEPRASAEHENNARGMTLGQRCCDEPRPSLQRFNSMRGGHGRASIGPPITRSAPPARPIPPAAPAISHKWGGETYRLLLLSPRAPRAA